MARTFFSIKRGSRLVLGSPTGKSERNTLVSSPSFFFSPPWRQPVESPFPHKDTPTIQKDLKVLRFQINSTVQYIAGYYTEDPACEEVYQGSEQLRSQLKFHKKLQEVLKCR